MCLFVLKKEYIITIKIIETTMEKEQLDNKTYNLIGRLAYALHEQDIKISYTSLIQILKDSNLDEYGSERGVFFYPCPNGLLVKRTEKMSA